MRNETIISVISCGLIVIWKSALLRMMSFWHLNVFYLSCSCWITDDSFFYSLNLVYFTLIFIFNSGILMAVGSSICRMNTLVKRSAGKTQGDVDRFNASCRSGLTLLGLTCLLGTTWGLAFLGSGYVNYPILYLFCILNSLQGGWRDLFKEPLLCTERWNLMFFLFSKVSSSSCGSASQPRGRGRDKWKRNWPQLQWGLQRLNLNRT